MSLIHAKIYPSYVYVVRMPPVGEVLALSLDNHCTQKGWRVLITLLINVVQSRTSKLDRKTFLIAPDDRIIMFGWV